MALAVRDMKDSPVRSMAVVQSSVIAFFENHQITKFISYAMSTGNWSTTHIGHASGNSMAAAVAVV